MFGDQHNFGQRVSISATGLIYKPRCIYWEYLFFSPQSPLRKYLRYLSSESKSLLDFDQILGDISIFSRSGFLEGEAEIVESILRPLDSRDLIQIGQLLGIAMVFGITDLHRGNLLITKLRAQIVDLECIFWDSQIPSETLLVPRNSIDWEKSFLGSIYGGGSEYFSEKLFFNFLSGFCEVMNFALKFGNNLKFFLQELDPYLRKYPIRILLRHTKQYYDYLKNEKAAEQFFPEEIEQLERCDIPYFFGYSGQNTLCYYASPGVVKEVTNIPPRIRLKVRRAFCVPSTLVHRERLLKIYKQSVSEIVLRFIKIIEMPYKDKLFIIDLSNNRVRIKTESFNVQFSYKET